MKKLIIGAVALAGMALAIKAYTMPNLTYKLSVVTKVGVSRTFSGGLGATFTPYPNQSGLGSAATMIAVGLHTPTNNCVMNLSTTSPIYQTDGYNNLYDGPIPVVFGNMTGSSCPPSIPANTTAYMFFPEGNLLYWTPAGEGTKGGQSAWDGVIYNMNEDGSVGDTELATVSFTPGS